MSPMGDRLERYGIGLAAAGFLCTRAIILVVALLAPQDRTRPDAPWWSPVPLVRWDSGHYGGIMMNGYPPEITDTVAFFPGYSLFARPFALVFSADVALIVASHVAALIGILFFYDWARRCTDARTAFWAVTLLSCYPPAMFFSAGYADAFFVACVAVALWLLNRRQLLLAACASAVATATRPTGVALAAVVLIAAIIQARQGTWPRRLVRWAAVGLLSISGLLLHELNLWHRYGRPDAYFAAQTYWAPQHVRNPWHRILALTPVIQPSLLPVKVTLRGQFGELLHARTWNQLFNLLIVILGVVGLCRPGRIPRVAFLLPIFIFLLAYLPDPAAGGRLVGIARYQLAALACFLLIARRLVRPRWWPVLPGVLAAGLFLQFCYVRGFCNWELVG